MLVRKATSNHAERPTRRIIGYERERGASSARPSSIGERSGRSGRQAWTRQNSIASGCGCATITPSIAIARNNYGCFNIEACQNCNYVYNSRSAINCHNSDTLVECVQCIDCRDCAFCVGLNGARFHILNREYSEQEYFAIAGGVGHQHRVSTPSTPSTTTTPTSTRMRSRRVRPLAAGDRRPKLRDTNLRDLRDPALRRQRHQVPGLCRACLPGAPGRPRGHARRVRSRRAAPSVSTTTTSASARASFPRTSTGSATTSPPRCDTRRGASPASIDPTARAP